MCGRFILSTPASKLVEIFQLQNIPSLTPHYNIAPTQLVMCIRAAADTQREAMAMRWGLVPFWAKDLAIGNRMINARSETVAEKPAFRAAFRKRRCLIPADGFYEWEKVAAGKKQPWLIHMDDRQPFAFAGLWESWHPRDARNGPYEDSVLSCSILTTAANADMSPIHDRMPVIVLPENYGAWISDAASPGQLQELMQPLEEGRLQRYRLSTIVNRPVNDSPECIVPLDETPPI